MTDPYAAHAAFVRPAWPARDFWRVIVMVFAFEIAFALSPVIFTAFLSESGEVAYYEGATAFGTLAQFFTFGLTAAAFVFVLRRVHRRGFWSMIGPYDQAWVDMKTVAVGVGLVLLFLEILPPWINPDELSEMRSLVRWLILLPIAVLAVLIQVTTEEMFFRGYLQQQFACLSPHRWAWMGIPSLMFGVLHYGNGNSFAEGLTLAVWATLLGLACADLTARTGTLGAAIGLHLVNNLFALLIIGVEGWPSSGLALFVFPFEDPDIYSEAITEVMTGWIIFQILLMGLTVLVMWLAARVALRR